MTSDAHRLLDLGRVAPDDLVETRTIAHWAVQSLVAVTDALLPRRDDDSQSNLGWSDDSGGFLTQALSGGCRAGLRFGSWSAVVVDDAGVVDSIPLAERTLSEVLDWFRGALDAAQPLEPRDYDMPAHAVGRGAPFPTPDSGARDELCAWFVVASRALERIAATEAGAAPVRCWPHHFDLATLVSLEAPASCDREDGRSIGIGLSPGDEAIAHPYLYVTPWPAPDGAVALPPLEIGVWRREGFVGALLEGPAIAALDGGAAQQRLVDRFLSGAVGAARAVLEGD